MLVVLSLIIFSCNLTTLIKLLFLKCKHPWGDLKSRTHCHLHPHRRSNSRGVLEVEERV
jgi:hypothetical protein